jgi:tartrate dehydratase beta subunit/fumarate hydratase class I family protein
MNIGNIKKIVEHAHSKKLPIDISDNDIYYSSSRKKFIRFDDMDLVHLIRAFKKINVTSNQNITSK